MKLRIGFLSAALIAGFFHVDHSYAQQDPKAVEFAKTITTSDLEKHLKILASDEYEGRETGQPGQKKAAKYLVDYYTQLGIEPIAGLGYYQTYPLKKESYTNSTGSLNGVALKFIKDFYTMGVNFEKLEARDLVFVGYGIEDKAYSDYNGVRVKNKVVVCMMGEPFAENGISKITGTTNFSEWSADWRTKREVAQSKGAKAILMVNMQYDRYMQRVRYWLEQPSMDLDYPGKREEVEPTIPVVFITPDLANQLLSAKKTRVENIQKKIDSGKKQKALKLSANLSFHMKLDTEKLEAENVLAYIPGTDPALKDELVVISAHYDHIGITGGQINNGADDDGSGTVTTMELAQAFKMAKERGLGTKRSLLFLHVSGEEKGLLGSEWYTAYPVFPLDNTVCNLNIDMIGRVDAAHVDENYVYLIGSDKLSTDLHKISENANATYTGLELDYTYNDPNDPNRFYYRSDHYNFAKNNIPVIFYFSGVHEDYHKPGDDVEKIRFDKMSKIGQLIFYTAWDVANASKRPKVDVPNEFKR